MVIDTSALLAVFLGEPERPQFLESITQAEKRRISAANMLETGIVLEARRGEAAGREFDLFLSQAKVDIVAVDAEQADIARHGVSTVRADTRPLSTLETASLMP
jgi:ribonuclease VapC